MRTSLVGDMNDFEEKAKNKNIEMDIGKCRQALCAENAASSIVRLMNQVDGDEYFGKVAANLLSFCVEKQTAGESVQLVTLVG